MKGKVAQYRVKFIVQSAPVHLYMKGADSDDPARNCFLSRIVEDSIWRTGILFARSCHLLALTLFSGKSGIIISRHNILGVRWGRLVPGS